MLPFLREVYYIPMQEAFGYDNLQMGILISVFGGASLLTYFPGGWIADQYSPRKLITGSLLATGVAGLYFASFPSYGISIAIHGFWGVCISLVFWGAMIKATREWAPAEEQGRAFGILESGRASRKCSALHYFSRFLPGWAATPPLYHRSLTSLQSPTSHWQFWHGSSLRTQV